MVDRPHETCLGLHPRKFCDRIKFLAVVNILKEYVAVADGLIEQLEIVLVSRGHWSLRADRTVQNVRNMPVKSVVRIVSSEHVVVVVG